MSVSEGIIASRRGCWRVQVGWHLDFESGLAGIGSAGPTIAPITKLPGTGRGFKVTPCRPGELQEPFPGMVAGSQPRLPGTSEGCGSGAAFLQPAFTSKFFCSANPCPLKKQGFPTPPPRPLHRLVLGHVCQKAPFVGGVERGLTLPSVLSSHMEFWRPQRSRASIWRAQELGASPSCPHGSCARSPRTKLIRGLVRMLRACSELSWRSPEIKPPREGCSQKKASRLAAIHKCPIIDRAESGQISLPIAGSFLRPDLELTIKRCRQSTAGASARAARDLQQLPPLGTSQKRGSDFSNRRVKAQATNLPCHKFTPRRSSIKMGLLDPALHVRGKQACKVL